MTFEEWAQKFPEFISNRADAKFIWLSAQKALTEDLLEEVEQRKKGSPAA